MAFQPSVNQYGAVTHTGDPVTIIDYPAYISVMEWGGTQSSAFGVSPVTTFAYPGSGITDDSALINAACLALKGSGITLMFPPGTYLVTANALNLQGITCQFLPGAIVTGTQAATLLGGQGQPFTARAVMTTVATSTTYTGTTTNTLTFGSNAAFGTQDGVSTLAVGDCVILQGGTLGSCAITACDTGPWIISSLGGASAKAVLVRPTWWAVGQLTTAYQSIKVGNEGTLFKNGTWTCRAAPGTAVSATGTDPKWYPDQVSTTVTLASSQNVLNTIPIFSATTSSIVCSLSAVGGTTTSTVGYGPIAAPTPGYIGTATVTIVAQASGMTKNGTADTSVVSVVVTNR